MITKEELIQFETEIAKLWDEGKINSPVHLSGGNEDQLIEIFKNIKREDYVLSTHRSHYHYLLHTGDKEGLYNEILGKPNGICGGNARSMHICNYGANFFSSAILAGMASIACGIGMSIVIKKENRHVWCFLGDGATDEGWFYEALKYAQGKDLPVDFIIEDNDRSVCTKKIDRWGDNCELSRFFAKVIYYDYTPTYPHVGTNKFVKFM